MAILVPGWPQPDSWLSLLKNFGGFNFLKPVGHSHITKRKKRRRKKIMIKMFLLSLYLLDTSKTSHASKMLDIVGISVNYFNKTLV